MKNIQYDQLYNRAEDFWDLKGNESMYLTPVAAVEVCLMAAQRGFVISRVEGGIWHHPGFEARVDCIWDGVDPPIEESSSERNNAKAADFIREERQVHGAFVITAAPRTGWPHLQMAL